MTPRKPAPPPPRNKVPLPAEMPGDFFVLRWDRDRGTFLLLVDDAARSSYNLGGDVATIQRYLRRLGYGEIGDRAIDVAKEFGAGQVIPREDRVIPIYKKPEQRTVLVFPGDADYEPGPPRAVNPYR